MSTRGFVIKVVSIDMLLGLTRYNTCHSSINSIQSGDESIELIGEYVSLIGVISEAAQNLVFVDVIKFFPVLILIVVVKQLTFVWVAQIRQLSLDALALLFIRSFSFLNSVICFLVFLVWLFTLIYRVSVCGFSDVGLQGGGLLAWLLLRFCSLHFD